MSEHYIVVIIDYCQLWSLPPSYTETSTSAEVVPQSEFCSADDTALGSINTVRFLQTLQSATSLIHTKKVFDIRRFLRL